jgi:Tol biopolymer transport system component
LVSDQEPAHSPNGEHMVFETERLGQDDEIWKMRVDGTHERKITDNSWDDDNPDWQPLP